MKARIGAALFGVGVLSLAIAAGLLFYVAPAVTKLPYDLKACQTPEEEGCLRPSVAVANNARFLQTKGGDTPVIEIKTGTLVSTTEVLPRADLTDSELTGDLKGNAVIWDVFGNVTYDQTKEMVSEYAAELALDRVSGAAAEWDKQYLQDAGPEGSAPVTFAGQTYKFPFNTEQKDYEYFDRDLRKALPIIYQEPETINGLEAYRFEQKIENQTLAFAPERLNGLLGRFAPGATSGKVTYSNTRTIWVEPVSGTFLKVREQQNKTLVPDVGDPVALLDGDFSYTDETIANSVKSAEANRSQLLLVSRYLPIGLSVLGALLLIVGLVLSFAGHSARNRALHRGPKQESTDSSSLTSA